jgi:hypothetical protein
VPLYPKTGMASYTGMACATFFCMNTVKPISTKMHGYLDYLMALVQIALPGVLQFDYKTTAGLIPVCLGIFIILYSLITNYEMGLLQVLPMKVHFALDIVGAVVLLMFALFSDFSKTVRVAYLVIAALEIVVVALSGNTGETASDKRKREFYSARK